MPNEPHPEPHPQQRPPRFRLPRRARTPWQAPRARTLFTRPAASPQRMLLQRFYLVVGLCVLAFAVLYLDRDSVRLLTFSIAFSLLFHCPGAG